MKKILVLLIVVVAIGAGLWFVCDVDSGKEKSVATKEEALQQDIKGITGENPNRKTDAMVSGKDTANAGQALKTTEPAFEPGVQDLITLIEDKKADPEKRREDFERLKKQYPEEALAFARVKADEFTLTNNDLLARIHRGNRRGSPDKGVEGDFAIGLLSVNLVMKTYLEKYEGTSEKIRFLIKTAAEKDWYIGSRDLIAQYCKDVDASIGFDFNVDEDLIFLGLCVSDFDLSSLEMIRDRHKDDWSNKAASLKADLMGYQCMNFKICRVETFVRRLQEDNNDNDIHKTIISILLGSPWAHCIPFEDMMKKAEKTGNPRFIDILMKSEQHYREKQRNCFNQQ